ncbi:hypothetical protein BRADI_2g60197v3 [Brachypodium distachyon]|uniref:Peptidase A1 domain-containing protein n=2 Tax=Brachypodium distachyon TaxID=15368 RepID=I1HV09_BRADI|nr:hypothetical protein BRADI_2g60197v3 [Brachypodium distachyon]
MARARLLLVLAVSLLLVLGLARPASCEPHLPVVVPVTKDTQTSLYTIPFHDGATLVLDTAGPLVWTTCQPDHIPAALACTSPTCKLANAFPFPGCRASSSGSSCPANSHDKCTVYPCNPVTVACAPGDLSHTRFVANTTDGRNPVRQVSVKALAACISPRDDKMLLEKLPVGSAGMAGLAGTGLALPAQVAASQGLPADKAKFLLCLPRGSAGGPGVAILGSGGPLYLLAGQPEDYTRSLQYTPLVVTRKDHPSYYVSVKSIAVDNAAVPEKALATGRVVLCTRTPYTLLRRDVYRPFAAAFEAALAKQIPRAKKTKKPPVKPFTLCYEAASLANTLSGYLVPTVTLAMEGGGKWALAGSNSMVDVKPGTACLAFVEMPGVKAGDGSAPAVIVGGFQMENFVLQFDLEKKRLGFFRLPVSTQCSRFNFTRTG